MQTCKLTILTAVDGQETKISRFGKLEVLSGAIFLQYREENAEVQITLKETTAKIERLGDYSLQLSLIPNQATEGCIGIGGNKGKISIYTHLVECIRKAEEIDVKLRYQLLFGEEPQNMELSLTAQTRGKIYEKNE